MNKTEKLIQTEGVRVNAVVMCIRSFIHSIFECARSEKIIRDGFFVFNILALSTLIICSIFMDFSILLAASY